MTFEELKQRNSILAARQEEKVHRRISHPEDELQKVCVSWFRESYPELAPLLFHPNNEAYFGKGRTARQQAAAGMRAKAMGVTPGVADLILLYPSAGKHGLCIEMKSKRGQQRDSQGCWQKIVETHGYEYRICKTIEEFRKILVDYIGKPPLDPDAAAVRRLFGDRVRVRK